MENENKIIEMIEEEYKTFLLSKKQLGKILSLSISGIDNLIANNPDKLPEYMKMGQGAKSSIRFSVISVAKYLTENGK